MPDSHAFPPPPSLRRAVVRVYYAQLLESLAHTPDDGILTESGSDGRLCLTITVTPLGPAAAPAPPPATDPEGVPRRGRRPGRCPAGVIIALRDGPLAYAELVRALPDSHENTIKSNLKRLVAEGYVVRLPDGRYSLPDD